MPHTHPCCGAVSTDAICCVFDPRGTSIREERHSSIGRYGKRLPGNWCCWCGDEVPEGRSFCGKACSLSYHEDVVTP